MKGHLDVVQQRTVRIGIWSGGNVRAGSKLLIYHLDAALLLETLAGRRFDFVHFVDGINGQEERVAQALG